MPYTQSKAMSGQGAKLEVCLYTTSPIVKKEVGELDGWAPQGEWETKDPTNLQSTIREVKPTLYAPGGVTTSVNRVATNEGQQLLQTAYGTTPNPLLRLYFTLPIALEAGDTTAGDVYEYTGYVIKYEPDVKGGGDIVKNQFTLKFAAFVGFTRGS